MKLIKSAIDVNGNTIYTFETSNGCTWKRARLLYTNIALEIRGWSGTRQLFELDEADKDFFPLATWRIEASANRNQNDPLFQTRPCRIKPGTKTVLEIFPDPSTDEPVIPVRVKNTFNWNS